MEFGMVLVLIDIVYFHLAGICPAFAFHSSFGHDPHAVQQVVAVGFDYNLYAVFGGQCQQLPCAELCRRMQVGFRVFDDEQRILRCREHGQYDG